VVATLPELPKRETCWNAEVSQRLRESIFKCGL